MTSRKPVVFILILFLCCLGIGGQADAGTAQRYTRTVENYEVPDVSLINQDGIKVDLRKLLLSDRPVLVDFIYTTCTTICRQRVTHHSRWKRRRNPKPKILQRKVAKTRRRKANVL